MTDPIRLGLRENAAQFTLLVVVNALVGGMVGQQQAILPLLAEEVFDLAGYGFIFGYIAAFGVAKAGANYVAGVLADRIGRRPVMILGWLVGIPVPLLIMWAPSWAWVIAANVLLGVNQGLTWSSAVMMKIDLVGPNQRGLAMGLNEAAGYGAIALTSVAAGVLAETYGLRPAPFLLGLGYGVIALALSLTVVRETRAHAELEARDLPAPTRRGREIFADATWRDPALASASQAGFVNNLNFGMSWGVFPLLFAGGGLSLAQIGALIAVYPGVWGAGQLVTGWLSDRWGRKPFVVGGMALQGLALAIVAASHTFAGWLLGAVILGLGTAAAYPALLAVIGDVAHPTWRGQAVGVYRVWRDLGYAAGAVVGALTAEALGLSAAVWAAAALSIAVAGLAARRLRETRLEPVPAA